MCGIEQSFPATSWDLLADVSRGGPRSTMALNEFAERYYGAVRAFIGAVVRDRGEIDDLTQRFFETVVLSGRLLTLANRAKGQFRHYLKQAIRNFLIDERRRDARAPQADVRPDEVEGGWDAVALNGAASPDAEMLRAWARSLVAIATDRLRRECEHNGQTEHFDLFARRYLAEGDPPSWREIGAVYGLDEKIARSRAETAARRFRSILRELVATDTGAEDTVDRELHAVIALL
jgi:DNA-directed RNA polymerase specialized sigma24 family protein